MLEVSLLPYHFAVYHTTNHLYVLLSFTTYASDCFVIVMYDAACLSFTITVASIHHSLASCFRDIPSLPLQTTIPVFILLLPCLTLLLFGHFGPPVYSWCFVECPLLATQLVYSAWAWTFYSSLEYLLLRFRLPD